MKEIKLSLRLTLSEYDTLVECVADELHRSELFAGEDSVLADCCSSLLEKIKGLDARLPPARTASIASHVCACSSSTITKTWLCAFRTPKSTWRTSPHRPVRPSPSTYSKND